MAERELCRNCGAKLKHDKTSGQYDPEYCSGLCRKKDGAEPYIKTASEQAMVVEEAKLTSPASYKDYQRNVGGRYVRRFEPEKLNWGKPMSDSSLLQAGFRANRIPIEGDWDYQEPDFSTIDGQPEMSHVEVVEKTDNEHLNEWQVLLIKARDLGIKTHGKKKEQIKAEIKENEND